MSKAINLINQQAPFYKVKRGLVWFFLLFHVFFLILLHSSCQTDPEKLKNFEPYDGPIMKTIHIQTVYRDSGNVKIILDAPLQLEYENGDQFFPKGIKLNFYNEEGVCYNQLTAQEAHYSKQENLYTGTGDVIVENIIKQERLNTEELNWSPEVQKIYTDKFVTITTPQELLKGDGLTANQDFTEYKITSPRGVFSIPEEEKNKNAPVKENKKTDSLGVRKQPIQSDTVI